MTRRAWWLVALNFLLPGSAQSVAGNKSLGRFGLRATGVMWALGIILAIGWFFARSFVYNILVSQITLLILPVLLLAYAAIWIILTLDTLRLMRLIRVAPGGRPIIAVVSILLLTMSVGCVSWGAYLSGVARSGIGSIFSAGPSEPPSNGRYNILILGGDAGEDRQGLRPDSLSVMSIDSETGQAVSVGLPRDMLNVPFAEGSPMAARYPNGYSRCDVDVCKLNSIYTEAEVWHSDWYPDAESRGSLPGIEATKDAAEGITGLEIHYAVLIDMNGFAQLIDALGGVTIDATSRLPIGGDEYLNNVSEWIEPGNQHMDGYHAQWYARSRHTTSDFDRMERQRQLQQAIIEQFEPVNVLTKFEEVLSAGSQVMQTDVPQSMLGYFVDLASKTKLSPMVNVELTPENGVDQENPDFEAIRLMVSGAMTESSSS